MSIISTNVITGNNLAGNIELLPPDTIVSDAQNTKIYTAGINRFWVNTQGRISIGISGVTTATETLDVQSGGIKLVDTTNDNELLGSQTTQKLYSRSGALYFNGNAVGGGFTVDGSSNAYYIAGNVGVGTNSPQEALHVHQTTYPKIEITNSSLATGNAFLGANGTAMQMTNDAGTLGLSSLGLMTLYSDGEFFFSGSNVGIGTNNPASLLHLHGSNPNLYLDNTAEAESGIYFRDSSDTANQYFRVLFDASTRSLRFRSSTNNPVLFLEEGGNVGLGDDTPSYQLELSTDSAGKPTTNTWTISSDVRLKEDIQSADYDQCYNDIKLLDLKYFGWKPEYIEYHSVKDHHKIGFIADDVEQVYPKAVQVVSVGTTGYLDIGITEGDTMKTLNTDLIINGMFGALKKVIEKIENIEDWVDSQN